MSEHRILDYNTPLQPDDITPGNVVMIHGEPRTIREVRPLSMLPYLPTPTPSLVVEYGQGQAQVFYVLTCGNCGVARAFPGLGAIADWYCGRECAITGLLA